MLPQFKHLTANDPKLPARQPVPHEAEFYIGISALVPPQNLALLFQDQTRDGQKSTFHKLVSRDRLREQDQRDQGGSD